MVAVANAGPMASGNLASSRMLPWNRFCSRTRRLKIEDDDD